MAKKSDLVCSLHERGVRVGGLYHGFLAECADPELADAFGTVLRLRQEGLLSKLACNKKGLPETIRSIADLEVHKFIVPTRVPMPQHLHCGAGLHIGVLGYDILRKNIHNQVAAALMIEDATIHVAGESAPRYWGMEHRIQRHPDVVPHGDFVELLGRMDLNLHLSYSESWGQLAAESLAMGVPCLIANHRDLYDTDSELRELLVSASVDDPLELYQILLENRDLTVSGRFGANVSENRRFLLGWARPVHFPHSLLRAWVSLT